MIGRSSSKSEKFSNPHGEFALYTVCVLIYIYIPVYTIYIPVLAREICDFLFPQEIIVFFLGCLSYRTHSNRRIGNVESFHTYICLTSILQYFLSNKRSKNWKNLIFNRKIFSLHQKKKKWTMSIFFRLFFLLNPVKFWLRRIAYSVGCF